MGALYLDYAAATPLDERVFAAMEPYLSERFYNPSAMYQAGRQVRADIEDARHRLAMAIGAKPTEIILTAGATESINLAIHGVLREHGGRVVTTPIEHAAVLEAARQYSPRLVTVDAHGIIDEGSLRSQIDDDTTLVSIGYANNELGTVQGISSCAAIVAGVREDRLRRGVTRPLYLHTDASQAAGMLDIAVSRLGVDLLTLNAAKCYGPKQVGLLWVRAGVSLAPLVDGGGQERGLRAGTENVAGIIGFAAALTIAQEARKTETYRLAGLRDKLQRYLEAEVPGVVINGHPKRRLPNFLHISVSGLDGERAVFALDQAGMLVATGSACAANKGLRSHVLTAVGMNEELADGSLRITLGRLTTEQDIQTAAALLKRVIAQERGR